jgi:hypothetical protein
VVRRSGDEVDRRQGRSEGGQRAVEVEARRLNGGLRLPSCRTRQALATSESKSSEACERLSRPVTARSATVNQENIFVAKNRDSESGRRRFCSSPRLADIVDLRRARRAMIQEMPAAQRFPAILTNADVDKRSTSCIAISTHCVVIRDNAACGLASARQHFLKWDAVFFDVLVYSG